MMQSIDPHFFALLVLLLGLMWLARYAADPARYFGVGCPGCDSRTPGEHADNCHFKGKD